MFCGSWLITLLCIPKLYQWNDAFNAMATYWTSEFSTLLRYYRRFSKIPMLPMIKAHMYRNAIPVEFNAAHCVMLRNMELPAGTGDIYGGANDYSDWGSTWVNNGTSVTNLRKAIESALLALECNCGTYSATQKVDFTAIREMMELVNEHIGVTWVPGVPDVRDLPGVVNVPSIVSEYLTRAITLKEDVSVGTDQWIVFPNPAGAHLNNLIPIKSYAPQSPYDTMALGLAKYGFFVGGTDEPHADVNTDGSMIGTDVVIGISNEPSVDTIFAAASPAQEYLYSRDLGAWTVSAYAAGYDTASQIEAHHAKDSLASKHIWWKALQIPGSDKYAFVDDQIAIAHEHYQPAQDLMEDYYIELCRALNTDPSV
jgi:hypothetical protein